MISNYSLVNNIYTLALNPEDILLDDFGISLLNSINDSNKLLGVIIDLSLFEVITTQEIKFIEKIINILKLNSIESIVCNFNTYSASIIFHFINEINFKTALDVEDAIDGLKSKQK